MQVHYLSNTNKDGTDAHCEKLGWKRLQEYDPDQRGWKYLNDLAEGSAVQEEYLSLEDEQDKDEDYYPSLPFAALYSGVKVLFVIYHGLSVHVCHIPFILWEVFLLPLVLFVKHLFQ